MDPDLLKLIVDYQRRVAEAVDMLEAAGVPRPTSDIAWTGMDVPGQGSLPGGFKWYKHGFGCSVQGAAWGVDFDFGPEGEIDGFDPSRLYGFTRGQPEAYGFKSEQDIKAAVQRALDAGALTFSGYILYTLLRPAPDEL